MGQELFHDKGRYKWQFNASDLYKDQVTEINWLKALPPKVGTKSQREYLLKSMKQFLEAKILQPSSKARSRISHGTVKTWFVSLHALTGWMISNGFWRFSQLGVDDLLAFMKTRRARHGPGRPAQRTLLVHIKMLEDLWVHRDAYVGSLRVNVCVFDSEFQRVCRGREAKPWMPVEEEAALPLIFDSIEWISRYGTFFTTVAAEIYEKRSKMVGLKSGAIKQRFTKIYRDICAQDPFPEIAEKLGSKRLDANTLARAFSVTQGAALNAILFIVGLRAAEVVRLDADCIEVRMDEYGQAVPYLKGVAAKRNGVSRVWVAGDPVPAIVKCMQELFHSVREQKEIDALFLARTQGAPVPLPGRRIARMGNMTLVTLMRAFADAPFRRDRPQIEGLHPHRARKTFARFVVKRDKRVLEALSFHFGHAYRAFTDGAYVGSDIELEQLMDAADRQELGRTLSVLLQASRLAGKGSIAIQKFKQASIRFHGKLALQGTVNQLIEKGVQIAPCDWGYCLYTPSLSACGGDHRRPNEVKRSPEVCTGCANFIVTPEHLSWWNARVEREETFLRERTLPDQARVIAERRLKESRRILNELVHSNSLVKL